MRHDDLDRILSGEHEIVPSSGFLSGVMEAVQRESTEPPPIPFPWKRALPGLAGALFVLGFSVVAGLATAHHGVPSGSLPFTLPPGLTSLVQATAHIPFGWLTVALICSFASVKLPALLSLHRSKQ